MDKENMEYAIVGLLIFMQVELIAFCLWFFMNRRKKTKFASGTLVDTSVLMDGRILSASRTGFVPSRLVIPRSVLIELQLLADGSDSDKRARARYGLDIAAELQASDLFEAIILDDEAGAEGVDNQLLALAKKYNMSICTIDFNLNKVAVAEGVGVLNINELASQLRMNHLPGERVSIKVIQKGNDAHQGVGYLADGTMVVVEQASSDINKQIEVEFIRSIQTAAGRMLFAKKLHKANSKKQVKPKGRAAGQRSKSSNAEDAIVSLANQ